MNKQERKDLHDYVARAKEILSGEVKSYDSLETRIGAVTACMDMLESYIDNGYPTIKPQRRD